MLKKLFASLCSPAAPVEPQVVASGIVERIGTYLSDADWVENRIVLFQGSTEILTLDNPFYRGWQNFAQVFALTAPGDQIEILGVRKGSNIEVADIRNLTLMERKG